MSELIFSSILNNSDIFPASPNSSSTEAVTVVEKRLFDTIARINSSLSEPIKEQSVFSFRKTIDDINESSILDSALETSYIYAFYQAIKAQSAKKEQERFRIIVNELVSNLVCDLEHYAHDEDYFCVVEHHICNIEHNYSFDTLGTVLQDIYVKYCNKPKMLVGICKALCRYDLDEVMPWGPTMLSGLLNNKSELVKEHAIELVENWSDTSMLPLLKSLEINSNWLRNYLQDVIQTLEE